MAFRFLFLVLLFSLANKLHSQTEDELFFNSKIEQLVKTSDFNRREKILLELEKRFINKKHWYYWEIQTRKNNLLVLKEDFFNGIFNINKLLKDNKVNQYYKNRNLITKYAILFLIGKDKSVKEKLKKVADYFYNKRFYNDYVTAQIELCNIYAYEKKYDLFIQTLEKLVPYDRYLKPQIKINLYHNLTLFNNIENRIIKANYYFKKLVQTVKVFETEYGKHFIYYDDFFLSLNQNKKVDYVQKLQNLKRFGFENNNLRMKMNYEYSLSCYHVYITKNVKLAIRSCDNYISLSKKTNSPWLILESYYDKKNLLKVLGLKDLLQRNETLIQKYSREVDSEVQDLEFFEEMYTNSMQYKISKINAQKAKIENIEIKNRNYQLFIALLIVAILTAFILLFFIKNRFNNKLIYLQNETKIQALNTRIEAEENERVRISKEIHDGLIGNLASVKIKLSNLNKDNLDSETKKIIDVVDYSIEECRNISYNLTPIAIKKLTLEELIREYVELLDIQKYADFYLEILNFKDIENLKLKKNVFRIIQELLSNTLRHAQATEVFLQVSKFENKFLITIEDNGKGFDIKKFNRGNGITNIENRLKLFNGFIHIETNEKGGTCINCELIEPK